MSRAPGAPSAQAADNVPRNAWRIFRWPIAIGVVTIVGLIAALVGDGWHDVVSWLALAVPVVVAAWGWRKG